MTYYKAEVSTGDPNRFDTNGLCFRTKAEAEAYARDLASRWLLVTDWRVRKQTNTEAARDSLYEIDLATGRPTL